MGQPSYIPRRPSPLHVSCSPPSPLSPLSPPFPLGIPPPKCSTLSLISPLPQTFKPPPPIPPVWTWSCHRCSEHYPLGATRRCLHDGHYFCSGSTVDKKGHFKKHKACGSVFDYVGWRAWGEWRRDLLNRKRRRGPKPRRNEKCGCGVECDFPSQCRWKPRLSTARLAAVTSIAEEDISPTSPVSPTLSEELDSPKSPTSPSSPPLLPKENLDRVLQSAHRRNSSSHSPIKHDGSSISSTFDLPVLSFSDFKAQMDKAHSAVAGDSASSLDAEFDGDTEMADVDFTDMELFGNEAVRIGPTTDPLALDYEFERAADSIADVNVIDAMDGLSAFKDRGTIDDREIAVEALPHPPVSPRRNAWDWSVGGLGTNIGSMDGFMDIDACLDI